VPDADDGLEREHPDDCPCGIGGPCEYEEPMTDADPDEIERLAREARAAYDETWPKGDSWRNVARFILTREQGLREERDQARSDLDDCWEAYAAASNRTKLDTKKGWYGRALSIWSGHKHALWKCDELRAEVDRLTTLLDERKP
jgi:hypothetical protein